MKIKLLVCQQCGHEEKIKMYDQADAARFKIKLGSACCSKCGSTNVRLHS